MDFDIGRRDISLHAEESLCNNLDDDCDGLTDGADNQSINVLCPARPNAQASACIAPQDCDYSCLPNYDDCNGPDVDLPVPLPGESYLGDGCEVYLSNNRYHCGQCGLACDDFEECVAGFCSCAGVGPDCTWPEICCLQDCVNSQTDNNHCGESGHRCGQNADCVDGVCTCWLGFGNCDENWDTGCEQTLQNNDQHCGECGNSCGDNANCVDIDCTCKEKYADCDEVAGCETPLGTVDDCADCADACAQHMECVDNNCVCEANYADCDVVTLGCETDQRTEFQHCGGCDQPCLAEQFCEAGVCTCSGSLADCDRDGVCECDLGTHGCNGSLCEESGSK